MKQTAQQTKAIFTALAIPCLNDISRFALSLTHSRTEAEDLVQDTYCRALEKFHTFDGRNIRSWLSSILYSLFIDGCRRKKIEGRSLYSAPLNEDGRASDPLDSPEVIAAAGSRENEAIERLACDDIQKAIDSLPEEFRSVIVLREQNDMSYKEIAAVLGCPAGTVMSRLNRGRKMLQELLRDQAEELGIPVPPRGGEPSSEEISEGSRSGDEKNSAAKVSSSESAGVNSELNAAENSLIDLNEYRRQRRIGGIR